VLRFLKELDPPGWIPAWFSTATVFGGMIMAFSGVGAAYDAFNNFGSVIATVYVSPLASWLAYKGWKYKNANS